MTPTIASILNFGGPDMMVILLIVFLLFGAKKLPELARGMGRAVKEFSAARDEIERELSQSSSAHQRRQNYAIKQARVSYHSVSSGPQSTTKAKLYDLAQRS